ncbi:hypothetical protein BJ980_000836 [Nocardioides daedukensis]|uniref:Glycosyltransferase RgtA/B/C/D-like domain-containing protein n=1 Tax=Nocardioides daedukensis TaxID=634462 RepID=A0A7Y9UMV8_9ACTN|nr:hypothetical protein [Nocardioides daedukensis]NYG57913.1 hypothetical protein [Nocardioides daedukensis]
MGMRLPAAIADAREPMLALAAERRTQIGSAVAMVIGFIGYRAWALSSSWFYLDDYKLLYDASASDFGLRYVLSPHNSNLMPGGRVLAWIVVQSGTLNWTVAALLILALQLLAATAAAWACFTLFGVRWAALLPLALYLTSAMTVPVMMWWTAGVNQVPLQAAFFLSIGAWTRYLRSRSTRWLLMTMCVMAFGLFFYVKALLLLPVLLFLLVGYFVSGTVKSRIRQLVPFWPGIVGCTIMPSIYTVYYLSHVSSPFVSTSPGLVLRIAETMIGTAFTTALVGGPWRWAPLAPPNAFASPPEVTVHLAWVLVALVVLYGFATRRRTVRAWVLLVGYLFACLALLVNSRGPAYGEIIGLEYRYLTDAACVAAICVGLVFIDIHGARDSSCARTPSMLRARIPSVIGLVVIGAIAIGGVLSTASYVRIWHEQNYSDAYVHTLQDELTRLGSVDLDDGVVPDAVIPGIFAPDNRVHKITELIGDQAQYPRWSPRLGVVAEDGSIRAALIGPGVVSKKGPREGCGWLIKDRRVSIPLTARAFNWSWWIRIGYLYSDESTVTVSADGKQVEAELQPGVNSLYVQFEGSFDHVSIDGLRPGTTLCVESIEVGPLVPGGPLE